MSRIAQHNPGEMLSYDVLDGRLELREQIARLMLDGGSTVAANEIVITNGCHGALSIALLSVCKPGISWRWSRRRFTAPCRCCAGLTSRRLKFPPILKPGSALRRLNWRWNSGRSRR
jgi:hypothetical protein